MHWPLIFAITPSVYIQRLGAAIFNFNAKLLPAIHLQHRGKNQEQIQTMSTGTEGGEHWLCGGSHQVNGGRLKQINLFGCSFFVNWGNVNRHFLQWTQASVTGQNMFSRWLILILFSFLSHPCGSWVFNSTKKLSNLPIIPFSPGLLSVTLELFPNLVWPPGSIGAERWWGGGL